MPITAPAAFSATVRLSKPIAVGVSLTLLTVSVNAWLVLRPPASVLVTVTLTLGSVSKSSDWPVVSFD